jgi:hypothetical protein
MLLLDMQQKKSSSLTFLITEIANAINVLSNYDYVHGNISLNKLYAAIDGKGKSFK